MTRRGDTLESVAAAVYRDSARWRDLALANDIEDTARLRPGRRLRVPRLRSRAASRPVGRLLRPEYVVRVDGAVRDPTTKGDILSISVVLDQQQHSPR